MINEIKNKLIKHRKENSGLWGFQCRCGRWVKYLNAEDQPLLHGFAERTVQIGGDLTVTEYFCPRCYKISYTGSREKVVFKGESKDD